MGFSGGRSDRPTKAWAGGRRARWRSGASAVTRSLSITLVMLGSVALSLAAALGAPMATAVIGLILFGVLHNLLEIRYVVGRFSGVLGRPFLDLLVALVTGIVVCRLLVGVVGRPARARGDRPRLRRPRGRRPPRAGRPPSGGGVGGHRCRGCRVADLPGPPRRRADPPPPRRAALLPLGVVAPDHLAPGTPGVPGGAAALGRRDPGSDPDRAARRVADRRPRHGAQRRRRRSFRPGRQCPARHRRDRRRACGCSPSSPSCRR